MLAMPSRILLRTVPDQPGGSEAPDLLATRLCSRLRGSAVAGAMVGVATWRRVHRGAPRTSTTDAHRCGRRIAPYRCTARWDDGRTEVMRVTVLGVIDGYRLPGPGKQLLASPGPGL